MSAHIENDDTSVTINQFAKVVKSHTTKKIGDPNDIINKIRQCKAATPTVCDERRVREYLKARNKVFQTLTEQYVVARMSTKFPLIDPSLFMLKRHLTIDKDKRTVIADRTKIARQVHNTISCNMPLFAVVPLEGKHTVELGKYVVRERSLYGRNRIMTYKVNATLPKPSQDTVRAARKALGMYHTIIGELYTHDELCDIVQTEPIIPKIFVTWIPTLSSLNVEVDVKVSKPKNNDPALMIELLSHRFLIKTYDIEEEESIAGFLREYTVGSTPVPLQ